MTRALWKWDAIAGELVTPDELRRRQDERSPKMRGAVTFRTVERGHWIYDRDAQEIVTAEEFHARRSHDNRSHLSAPMLIKDIEPYQAVGIPGAPVIGSRRQHRDTLRAHGKVEVGNDFNAVYKREKPQARPVREDIKRAIQQVESGYRPAELPRDDLSGAVVV